MFLCVFYIPDVTGEMEVTVQEDEERPPPPPPEEQSSSSESRDPRTANRNPTLELAESIVDSVLGPCTSEATIRLSNIYYCKKGQSREGLKRYCITAISFLQLCFPFDRSTS